MSTERYKELKKNTIIIAVSNIGSKAMIFLLAPLYSFFLSPEAYGISDIITASIGLFVPFICLDIYEATFRYANDETYDKRNVVCTSLWISFPGLLVCILTAVIAAVFGKWEIAITSSFVALTAINMILSQFLRGLKEIKVFGLSGIINAIALSVASIVLVVCLKLGFKGWALAYFTGLLCSCVYLTIKSGVLGFLTVDNISKKYAADFLCYCIPLIPTAAMWWIMNASDRYIIGMTLGAGAAGIYAVSNKIPAILSAFERVFYQAWQTTSIETSKEKEKAGAIYSEVFNNYFVFLSVGVLGLLVIGKQMIIALFDKAYHNAWTCLAILIVSVMVHALAGNVGTLYSTYKYTKGAFYSSLSGSVTNICLNLFFIPRFGIMGAAVATLIGYLVTFIYRVIDVRKLITLKYDKKKLFLYTALIVFQVVFFYTDGLPAFLIRLIIFLGAMISSRKLLFRIIAK